MRRFAILAVAMVATACATTPQPKTAEREIARLPAADAIGLTRSDLEQALGIVPVQRLAIRDAVIADGDLEVSVNGASLARGTNCRGGAHPSLRFVQGGEWLADADFRLRGGKVVAVTHRATRSDSKPGAQDIVAVCRDKSNAAETQEGAQFAMAAPVLFPLGGLLALVNSPGKIDINKPLSKLPLGAMPPGGLDAYLASLPRGAVLAERAGKDARIEFRFFFKPDLSPRDRGSADATVHIANGVVTKLSATASCIITPTHTLECESGFP